MSSLSFSRANCMMVMLLIVAATAGATEVNYPTQPVRIISAFPAGGGVDLIARALAQKYGAEWKGTIVVEAKPGGGGDIATEYVARSPADGHTLLATTNATIVINPQLFKEPGRFDPVRDLAPVTLLARQTFVLVVNNSLPIKTVGDLISYARAHPGKLTFGSSGTGGGAHLSGEMLKAYLKLDMTHVPYKGVAPGLQDLIAGHIDFMFASIITAKPLVESNQLRGLAVTSKTRSPFVPELPAVAEHPGLENFEADLWYGLLAPPKTDPAIITKLHRSTVRAFQAPDLKTRFEQGATTLEGAPPEEFAQIIKSDLAKWALVIAAANMAKK